MMNRKIFGCYNFGTRLGRSMQEIPLNTSRAQLQDSLRAHRIVVLNDFTRLLTSCRIRHFITPVSLMNFICHAKV